MFPHCWPVSRTLRVPNQPSLSRPLPGRISTLVSSNTSLVWPYSKGGPGWLALTQRSWGVDSPLTDSTNTNRHQRMQAQHSRVYLRKRKHGNIHGCCVQQTAKIVHYTHENCRARAFWEKNLNVVLHYLTGSSNGSKPMSHAYDREIRLIMLLMGEATHRVISLIQQFHFL